MCTECCQVGAACFHGSLCGAPHSRQRFPEDLAAEPLLAVGERLQELGHELGEVQQRRPAARQDALSNSCNHTRASQVCMEPCLRAPPTHTGMHTYYDDSRSPANGMAHLFHRRKGGVFGILYPQLSVFQLGLGRRSDLRRKLSLVRQLCSRSKLRTCVLEAARTSSSCCTT
jgi:hypothetical protein